MTVKELITELSKLDQESHVCIKDQVNGQYYYSDVDYVSEEIKDDLYLAVLRAY